MHLTLVRHGEPERAPIDPRDPALDERGRAQARGAGLYLATDVYDAVYSSPQLRAVQTARIATDGTGISVVLDDGLVEFDFGAEYVHYDDAADPVWSRYFAGDLSPWGLTAAAFHARIRSAMNAISERHRGGNV